MNPLRIALLATNNDKVYSGGRYHALIIAYALALTGAEVEFITNEVPRFAPDLAPIAPERVKYHRSNDFEKGLPKGEFDFAIVVPTGQFLPRFYERAVAFARQAKARIGLINFESANMYNALSPAKRDTRPWDYWRRILGEGGLVISSTRVSDGYARDFYRNASGANIRFEVCSPAINSAAARESDSVRKDGSVIAFVRPSDVHKGAHDLLSLDPLLLAGRTLHLVSGGDPDMDYADALARHLGPQVDIVQHTAISDMTKFRLLAGANALLFPSRFEGFGYPPVEAAFAGVETVAYDLPVLQETVGPIAHLARVGDVRAFNHQLEKALSRGERRDALRAHIAPRVDVNAVATRLGDILLRSADSVPRLGGKRTLIQWGPFEREEPDPTHLEIAPVSPGVVSYARRLAGDSLLSLTFASRAPVSTLQTTDPHVQLTDVHLRLIEVADGWRIMQATFLLPPIPAGARLTLEARAARDNTVCATIPLELGEAEPLASALLQLEAVEPAPDGGSILSFAYLGSNPVDEAVVTTDGANWVPTTLAGKSFTVRVKEPNPHMSGVTMFLFDRRRPVAGYGGFPPRRRGRRSSTASGERQLMRIARTDGDGWRNGFLLRPLPPLFGALRCVASQIPQSLKPGAIIRMPSGRLMRVAELQSGDGFAELYFREPLNADLDGQGDEIELIRDPSSADMRTAGQDDLDPSWRDGVWCGAGPLYRRGVVLPWGVVEAVAADVDNPGCIRVSATELRRTEQIYDNGGHAIAWLDRPWPEDAPSPAGREKDDSLALDPFTGNGWINGVALEGPLRGRAVRLRGGSRVRERQVLKFSRSGLRRIAHVKNEAGATIAVLERPIALDRPEQESLRLAWPSEIEASGGNNLMFANEVKCTYASPLLGMLDRYRIVRRGDAPAPAPVRGARKRVLFLSVVPPLPADQGNRIVTHNFIAHLVAQGHDVDVVVLGDMQLPGLMPRLGDHVRFFCCPYPDWEKAPSAMARKKILDELRNLKPGPPERDTIERLRRTAREYHPYFIVPDAMVRTAAALYRSNAYHSIVCNYTHIIRIAKELETIRPLPPVAVITHDALSRLPTESDGVELDTGSRLCTPEVESEVLNAAPNARILAISRSERGYFAQIGVTNPIVLCEYDGLGEIRGNRATPGAFENKRLVFQASGNPMNVSALNWFVRNCWPAILHEVPEAQLVVSGRVSKGWKAPLANIETQGILSRLEMLEELGGATIALNPTLAGTGLKIKTVEAACAGVPSVCLPAAIEGLEDVADNFAITATNAAEFTAACLRLLTDRDAWMALHQRALDFSAQRFDANAVYGDIDMLMDWSRQVLGPQETAPRPAPRLQREIGDDVVAARAAMAREDVTTALDHFLTALATDPTNLAAFEGLIRLALEEGWRNDAIVLLKHAALAAPLDPELPRLEALIAGEDSAYHATAPSTPTVPLAFNTLARLPELVGYDTPAGVGWGAAEEWGAWSDGPYARLAISHQASDHPLELRLRAMAVQSSNEPPQQVTVYVDGLMVAQTAIARDGGGHDFPTVRLAGRPEGEIVIEFLIGSPGRVRDENGVTLDRRHLGIGLLGIGLFEMEGV